MDAHLKLTRVQFSARSQTTIQSPENLWEDYHQIFLEGIEPEEYQEDSDKTIQPQADDIFESTKSLLTVPTRKQVKTQSAKIVEELSKRDE